LFLTRGSPYEPAGLKNNALSDHHQRDGNLHQITKGRFVSVMFGWAELRLGDYDNAGFLALFVPTNVFCGCSPVTSHFL